MGGGADSVFTLKQEGGKLTGTVEGAAGGFGGGGGDQPVPIEDGKVDGNSVSFRAGTTTYTGTVRSAANCNCRGPSPEVVAADSVPG